MSKIKILNRIVLQLLYSIKNEEAVLWRSFQIFKKLKAITRVSFALESSAYIHLPLTTFIHTSTVPSSARISSTDRVETLESGWIILTQARWSARQEKEVHFEKFRG